MTKSVCCLILIYLVSSVHSHLFPRSLELSFPHLSYLTSFPLLCCQCCRCCPIVPGKRTLQRDRAECRLPRNASQSQVLDLTFIYFPPKPLHHNPCWIWYWDSCGSKSMKALVNGWVQVTPTSVPSYLKTWRCSRIYAGCGDDIPSPGRCPLGQKPTLQLQVLSAMLYLLPSLWRSRLCTDTLCVFRKPH